MSNEIYVRVLPLPGKVHGFTHLEPDGSYTILINEADSEARRMQTYQHELEHIQRDDFEPGVSVQKVEAEAHHIEAPAPLPSPKRKRRRRKRFDKFWREYQEMYDRIPADKLFGMHEDRRLEE